MTRITFDSRFPAILRRRWIGAGAALVLIAALATPCALTTVPPRHNQVATLFGEVRGEPYGEGMHLVNPLLSFTPFDLRAQTYTFEKVQVPSQDKLKTSMDVSITLRIESEATPRILQETGTPIDVIEKHVTPKVRSLLREAGKSVERSQDFYVESVQQELQAYMEAGLAEYLERKGVVVEAVLFRDITLPPVVQTKERQEQLEREKAQLRIVEQQAQQNVVQAQAHERAAIAEANAHRTQTDAVAYRIVKEAKARAQANELLAASITPELMRYNQVERWNGSYPQTLLTGDQGSILLTLPADRD